MRSGEIDLAIGAISASDKDLISIDIVKDRYICLVRANHPIAKSRLTRSSFSKLRFFFARTTSTVYQLAEQWLADEAARPQIAVRAPAARTASSRRRNRAAPSSCRNRRKTRCVRGSVRAGLQIPYEQAGTHVPDPKPGIVPANDDETIR